MSIHSHLNCIAGIIDSIQLGLCVCVTIPTTKTESPSCEIHHQLFALFRSNSGVTHEQCSGGGVGGRQNGIVKNAGTKRTCVCVLCVFSLPPLNEVGARISDTRFR